MSGSPLPGPIHGNGSFRYGYLAVSITGCGRREDSGCSCPLQAEKLEGAQGHFEAAWAHFQDALDQLPEEDRGKKLKPVQVGAPHPAAPQPAASASLGVAGGRTDGGIGGAVNAAHLLQRHNFSCGGGGGHC